MPYFSHLQVIEIDDLRVIDKIKNYIERCIIACAFFFFFFLVRVPAARRRHTAKEDRAAGGPGQDVPRGPTRPIGSRCLRAPRATASRAGA